MNYDDETEAQFINIRVTWGWDNTLERELP